MGNTVGADIAAGTNCTLAAESADDVEAAADMVELEGIVQLEDTAVPGCSVPVVGRGEAGSIAEVAADIAEVELEGFVQDTDGFVDTAAADTAEVADIVEAAGTVEPVDTAELAGTVETIE